MANSSIYAAFERMWQHVIAALGNKANLDHAHDDIYYTKEEIDNKGGSEFELITTEQIDAMFATQSV